MPRPVFSLLSSCCTAIGTLGRPSSPPRGRQSHFPAGRGLGLGAGGLGPPAPPPPGGRRPCDAGSGRGYTLNRQGQAFCRDTNAGSGLARAGGQATSLHLLAATHGSLSRRGANVWTAWWRSREQPPRARGLKEGFSPCKVGGGPLKGIFRCVHRHGKPVMYCTQCQGLSPQKVKTGLWNPSFILAGQHVGSASVSYQRKFLTGFSPQPLKCAHFSV